MTDPLFPLPQDPKSQELGDVLSPRFDANGLITAIAQDHDSGEILMVAFMNAEALARTISTGEAHYWSRSRGELWHKGATSGHVQRVREMRVDCDQDAVLLRVTQQGGGACHVGYRSCFYRKLENGRLVADPSGPAFDPAEVYDS